MWAIARVDLGLSTKEFGRLTPRQFHALVHRLQAADQKHYMGHGIVASTIVNAAPFADPKREASQPTDFVPGYKAPKRKEKVMSVAEQIALLSGAWKCGPMMPKQKDGTGAHKSKA